MLERVLFSLIGLPFVSCPLDLSDNVVVDGRLLNEDVVLQRMLRE